MRKGDLELLEVRLEPLQTARDRLETAVGEVARQVAAMTDRVKDLERNEEVHKTEIAQGLASIRSLLQRANRAAREVGIVDEDEIVGPLDVEPAGVKVGPTIDERIRAARIAHPERTVL